MTVSIQELMTDSANVNRAFAFVECNYSGTPCWECKSRKTGGVIFQGVVSASCEECGGRTRIGRLADLWNPQQAESARRRPVLRAAQEPATRGRSVRRRLP